MGSRNYPITMYLKIKSQYIKSRIKELSWEKHFYINHLIALERFVINCPKTFTGNIYFSGLKSKYRKDFIGILKELKPKAYLDYQGNEKKLKLEQLKRTRQDKKEEKKLKSEWRKMGGKV